MKLKHVRSGSQIHAQSGAGGLTRGDRQLVLGASLPYVWRRYRCGKPIRFDDLRRLLALADDAGGQPA